MQVVAQRIEKAVIRGEIDNTLEGRTIGRIWLFGRAEPLELDLVGDCWRDLAGAKLKFSNPQTVKEEVEGLSGVQTGVVGDITASRKARVPTCGLEEMVILQSAGEPVPTVWKHVLYLEWFSAENGRVVIEATDFQLELSESIWSMDADAEEAQKMANLQAMRDFLEGVIARRPERRESRGEDDEFEWERRLRDSDRMTDAYQEVLEKYMDDPDAQQKEAFVMGWDGLLGAMAEAGGGKDPVPVEETEWEDEDEDELFRPHPLQEEAQEMAIRAHEILPRHEHEAGYEDSVVVSSTLTEVAAKLAGALNGTYDRETGYVLAILKRCLARQNEAFAACRRILDVLEDSDESRAVEAFRDEIFALRTKLTDMRQELKRS